MPRKPRFALPGIPQHVIQRGNNRAPCFHAEDDYTRYLNTLREALLNNACQLHAYVLMTNHVHLLLTPSHAHGIAHVMQDVGRKYVLYFNKKYDRSGTLWEGRYKASLVDSEAYLLTCMHYIELNPVRANIVAHPREYRWSSYAANGQGRKDPLITPNDVYLALGTTPETRQQSYRELSRGRLATTQIQSIRDALNQELVLGRDAFKDTIEQLAKRPARRGRDGRPRINEDAAVYAGGGRRVY